MKALIAELREAAAECGTKYEASLMNEAADALVAQQARIAELEHEKCDAITWVMWKNKAEKAEAALRQAVPREPTEAMLVAGTKEWRGDEKSRSWTLGAVWRAMYDAAPTAAPKEKT